MPNDAALDPTVHNLFAKNRFNRGKSSRSWPLYPRCGHDLSPPRCPPFLEAGTPDLLWLYKSQRKASEGRGIGENAKINKKAGDEREKQGQKKKKKQRPRKTKKERTKQKWREVFGQPPHLHHHRLHSLRKPVTSEQRKEPEKTEKQNKGS
jgi:hypothetical protein